MQSVMIRTALFLLLLTLVCMACSNDRKKIIREHPDGFFREVFYVTDDSIRNGPYVRYSADGRMLDSCGYTDNKIHGIRKIFGENGNPEILESYEMGKFNGPYISFYPNGTIRKKMKYIDNKIEGELTEYHPNGKLKAILHMQDNLENGPFREFYPDGTIHWEGFYLNGEYEQDTLNEYNPQGQLIRKLFCEKGICQTVWTLEEGNRERTAIFTE